MMKIDHTTEFMTTSSWASILHDKRWLNA